MEIRRTANAGVLLKIDGISILLDGLCKGVGAYLPTPDSEILKLNQNPPELLAFTHSHADHYDEALVSRFLENNLRPILGPENLPLATCSEAVTMGGVTITPVESRHLGKVEPGLKHFSYVIEGSSCVWFTGDAAPSQWKNKRGLPQPDIIIAPYAYGLTQSAWKQTCEMAEAAVIVHMPDRSEDPYGLWPAVEAIIAQSGQIKRYFPLVGETLYIKE